MTNFSSVLSLFRVTAWLLKFIERLKKLVDNTPACEENDNGIDNTLVGVENVSDITVRDFIKAKLLWIKENKKKLDKSEKFEN